jgi:hypothetical protein
MFAFGQCYNSAQFAAHAQNQSSLPSISSYDLMVLVAKFQNRRLNRHDKFQNKYLNRIYSTSMSNNTAFVSVCAYRASDGLYIVSALKRE